MEVKRVEQYLPEVSLELCLNRSLGMPLLALSP